MLLCNICSQCVVTESPKNLSGARRKKNIINYYKNISVHTAISSWRCKRRIALLSSPLHIPKDQDHLQAEWNPLKMIFEWSGINWIKLGLVEATFLIYKHRGSYSCMKDEPSSFRFTYNGCIKDAKSISQPSSIHVWQQPHPTNITKIISTARSDTQPWPLSVHIQHDIYRVSSSNNPFTPELFYSRVPAISDLSSPDYNHSTHHNAGG